MTQLEQQVTAQVSDIGQVAVAGRDTRSMGRVGAMPASRLLGLCALAGLGLLVLPGSAAADQASVTAVDKLVRAHIAASIRTEQAFLDTLTLDAHLTLPDGSAAGTSSYACLDDPGACTTNVSLYETVSDIYGTYKYASVSKPAIYVDDANHVACFQAVARLSVDGSRGESTEVAVKGKTAMRFTGIAVVEQGAWKIAAIAYAPSLPDRVLFESAEQRAPRRFAPTTAVEREVMSWVGHFAEHVSPRAIGAAGSAPKEIATKPAAIAQLARTWDKLALDITYLHGIERGNVAFLWGAASRKVKSETVALVPIIVVEKDGQRWQWVAISWMPAGLFEESLGR